MSYAKIVVANELVVGIFTDAIYDKIITEFQASYAAVVYYRSTYQNILAML